LAIASKGALGGTRIADPPAHDDSVRQTILAAALRAGIDAA